MQPLTGQTLPTLQRPLGFDAFNRFPPAGPPISFQRLPAPDTADAKPIANLDEPVYLSPRKAVGLFSTGLLAAAAGGGVLKLLSGTGATQVARREATDTFSVLSHLQPEHTLNPAVNFSEPMSAMLMLGLHDPAQRRALAMLGTYSALGYLSGNVLKGVQETVVRRAETGIRSHLLHELPSAFQDSLQTKQQIDDSLRVHARQRITALLSQAGIADTTAVLGAAGLSGGPTAPNPEDLRHFYMEPRHLSNTQSPPAGINGLLPFGGRNTGNTRTNAEFGTPAANNATSFFRPKSSWLAGGIFAAGVLTGAAVQGLARLAKTAAMALPENGKTTVYHNISTMDKASWTLFANRSGRNAMLAAGVGVLAAGVKLGQMALEGLRQIEVTRVNAKTERDYQSHNWRVTDPMYHRIAEEQALTTALDQLARDMPQLSTNPAALQQRIRTVLDNIGRQSAPAYFMMTPAVGLVDARS
ncbi:MAG: hypothetical protein AB7P76_04275 [Candidatus Melainabacteria bacterium]